MGGNVGKRAGIFIIVDPLKFLRSLGTKIRMQSGISPKDLLRDDIDFSQSAVIPISSIRQPAAEIGKSAVELRLREDEATTDAAREQVLFTPELLARASTAGSDRNSPPMLSI